MSQTSYDQLVADINSTIPDNTLRRIKPANVRQRLLDIVDSVPVVSGTPTDGQSIVWSNFYNAFIGSGVVGTGGVSGSGLPGGILNELQYNLGGGNFGGANIYYDHSTQDLHMSGVDCSFGADKVYSATNGLDFAPYINLASATLVNSSATEVLQWDDIATGGVKFLGPILGSNIFNTRNLVEAIDLDFFTLLDVSGTISADWQNRYLNGIWLMTSPKISGTIAFEHGKRQTFNPSLAVAGFNVGSVTADPTSLVNGDIWYNSASNFLKFRSGGTTVVIPTGVGGGDLFSANNLSDLANSGTALTNLGVTAFGKQWLGTTNSGSALNNLGVTSYAKNLLAANSSGNALDVLGVTSYGKNYLAVNTSLEAFSLTSGNLNQVGPVSSSDNITSIDWNQRTLYDISGVPVANWKDLVQLFHVVGDATFDNNIRLINGATIEDDGLLINIGGITVLDGGITVSGNMAFEHGKRQTFNPSLATPGFNPGSVTTDPTTTINGDIWYNSTSNFLKTKANSTVTPIMTGMGNLSELASSGTALTNLGVTSFAKGLLAVNTSGNALDVLGFTTFSKNLIANQVSVPVSQGGTGRTDYTLYDNAGTPKKAANWNIRYLYDANGTDQCIGWSDRVLVRGGNNTTLDWGNRIFAEQWSFTTGPQISGTIGFEHGVRQTFNPSLANVGLNVGSVAADPTTLVNGDIWYDSVTAGGSMKMRIGGNTITIGPSGAGGGGTLLTANNLSELSATSGTALTNLGVTTFAKSILAVNASGNLLDIAGVTSFAKNLLAVNSSGNALDVLGVTSFARNLLAVNASGNALDVLGVTSYGKQLVANTTGAETISLIGQSTSTTTQTAAGTAYSLTNTAAAVTFGTTSPAITIPAAGTWRVHGWCHVYFNGATFAADQTVTIKLRRTNNTAGDLTNASVSLHTGIVTTLTATMAVVSWEADDYTTSNSNDSLTIFASVGTTPSAGSLQIDQAKIYARWIF